MSVRMTLAFAAGLFLVFGGNSGNSVAEAHGAAASAAGSASTSWNDATLNAAKVDYYFSAMEKLTDYAVAHPDFDMDAIAMDGNESEADYTKRMNADPKLRKVFAAMAIDPLRYANVTGVMTGTMLGVGLAGKMDPSKMPQAAQYYLAHKAQIEARMKAFEDKARSMIKQSGGDDSE
jgi:hypothetical protein